jgi:FkbM family methyltransferase
MTTPFDDLFSALPTLYAHHAPSSATYRLLRRAAREQVELLFGPEASMPAEFGPFGLLIFPFHEMGTVDSRNLFDLDELILFSFYNVNRTRYHRVADIGANLGLHSTILGRAGFEVRAFEPDPRHFRILSDNLAANLVENVEINNSGVSSIDGSMDFVRVVGNTTSSHLAGSKSNVYGELERFPVRVEKIGPIIEWADLLKIDAEGHEKEIITGTTAAQWANTDALIEVENADNAAAIFDHLSAIGINLFSQKTNWSRVDSLDAMPGSYRDGTLFVTARNKMNWLSETGGD